MRVIGICSDFVFGHFFIVWEKGPKYHNAGSTKLGAFDSHNTCSS